MEAMLQDIQVTETQRWQLLTRSCCARERSLFRANPHLTLHARQATAHVTPRRSARARFTLNLTHSHRPPPCALHHLTSAH
jgi:hypothetical protein